MIFELYYVASKKGEALSGKGWLLSFQGNIVPYYLSPVIFDLPLRKGFPYLEKEKLTPDGSFKKYLLYRRYFSTYISPAHQRDLFPMALFALITGSLYFPYEVIGSCDKTPSGLLSWRILIERSNPIIAHVKHESRQEQVVLDDLSSSDLKRIERTYAPYYAMGAKKNAPEIKGLVLPRCKHYPYLTYDIIDAAFRRLIAFWPVKDLPLIKENRIMKG